MTPLRQIHFQFLVLSILIPIFLPDLSQFEKNTEETTVKWIKVFNNKFQEKAHAKMRFQLLRQRKKRPTSATNVSMHQLKYPL